MYPAVWSCRAPYRCGANGRPASQVVHRPFSPNGPTPRDGRLYGRGTCDMKGFVAACVAMAPIFAARDLKVPVHFAFTYDEEIGCLGAQALTATLVARGVTPAAAIIGEPSMMQPVDGHKGCFEYTTRFTGLEGHGSSPDLGVNAVEYAARWALRLAELREVLKTRAPAGSAFMPPHSTINIGVLAGGLAHNVIPGAARLEWEMRPVAPEDADFVKAELAVLRTQMLAEMQGVFRQAAIETETIAEVVGLTPDVGSAATRLVMELTGANRAGLVPFGTEAGLFQQIGIPSVICGPGDIAQAHKPDEISVAGPACRLPCLLEQAGGPAGTWRALKRVLLHLRGHCSAHAARNFDEDRIKRAEHGAVERIPLGAGGIVDIALHVFGA